MIITVTMNPAIDKTVEVANFMHGGLNRIRSVEYDAGGKGINVSKTICELGGQSIATGFLAGNNGQTITRVLQAKGIACDFVNAEGETRTNTKVAEPDGTLTELNEPGPHISEQNISELKEKVLAYAKEGNWFVFSGSIPAGVPKSIYRELIAIVKAKGARVLLDADGEAFREAVEAGPDFIKPNRAELADYCGLDAEMDLSAFRKAADRLQEKGVANMAISMGESGAVFLLDGTWAVCPGLDVEVRSTVGAGDAMAAALVYAAEQRWKREDMIRLSMAVSAGAVMTTGTKPPSKETVKELIKKVTIKETGETCI